jgi:hypothetical protein
MDFPANASDVLGEPASLHLRRDCKQADNCTVSVAVLLTVATAL